MQSKGKFFVILAVLAMMLGATGALQAGEMAQAMDAQTAFEKLKAMAGTWEVEVAQHSMPAAEEGEQSEAPEEAPDAARHVFRVSAAGSVVMETMRPDTDHEMINMYHLDGDDLVMTHYCAAGNQPTMRLDLAHASADTLPFVFTGGTNLDPATDGHIHGGKLVFLDDGRVESHWTGYNEGKDMGTTTFLLARADGE